LDVLLAKQEQVSMPSKLLEVAESTLSRLQGQTPNSASDSASSASSTENSDASDRESSSEGEEENLTGHGSAVSDVLPGDENIEQLLADMEAFDAAHPEMYSRADNDEEVIDYSQAQSQDAAGRNLMYEDVWGPRPGTGTNGNASADAASDDEGFGDVDENDGIAALDGADSEEEDKVLYNLHKGSGLAGEEDDSESEDDGVDDGGAVGVAKFAFDEASSNSDSDSDSDKEGAAPKKEVAQSSFQRRQALLAQEVAELETRAVAAKSWALRGEVGSGSRPKNSLLEATLDMEARRKLAPVMTEEVSSSLEELIIRRIKDEAWDDVQRRATDNEAAAAVARAKKELPDVSTAKDRAGLGDVYAKEYESRVLGVQEESAEAKSEVEVQGLWAALSRSLDALTNFHFTPQAAAAEDGGIAVKKGVPAVAMEEALPTAMATASAAAPEELHAPARGTGKAAGELSTQERRAARRAAKGRGQKRSREKDMQAKRLEASDPARAKMAADARMRTDLERNANVSLAATRRAAGAGADKVGLASVASSGHIKSTALFSALQAEAQNKLAAAGAKAAGTAGRTGASDDGADLRRSKKSRKGKSKGGAANSAAATMRL
jgi:U3 small nucleolar RNA-associated protein MPP10